MATVKHPLLDLVYNDETGRYIAVLERKILYYVHEDLRMRALLELLTGDMWDDADFRNMGDEELTRIAVDTLKRRANMGEDDARNLVAQRWRDANVPEPDPAVVGKIYAGPDPNAKPPHTVSISRPIAATTPYNHELHLRGLEQAAKNRGATTGDRLV